MRGVFFFLLVLNVCFFVWHFLFGDSPLASERPGRALAASQVDAPTLTLLSEVGASRGESETTTSFEDSFAPDDQCWIIGPFDDEKAGQDAVTRLRASGVALYVRKLARPVQPDYWVHIVPQANRDITNALARDLQAREVKSFIIAQGKLENGISLGIYPNKRLADEVVRDHRDQPYEVAIEVLPRHVEEVWGLMPEPEYNKLSDRAWQRFSRESGDLELAQNYCAVVASQGKLE